MSTLLIVESPGKIKKISEYLGHEYIVMASIGHIIDLDEKTMSIDLETFEPKYKAYSDKLDVIAKLKKQVNIVGKDNVLLAADEDREGEMIAWSLAKELGINSNVAKRIVFNSITKKELDNAIKSTKLIDLNMVKAQQARRILDRLAGYTISPILNKSGFRGAQSAGRVQSVVVKIVVDKEKEIEKFYLAKSDSYFYITSDIKLGDYQLVTKLANKDTKIMIEDKNFDDLDNNSEDAEDLDINEVVDKPAKSKSKSKKKESDNIDINAPSNKSCIIFTKEQEDLVITIIKNMVKAEFKLLNMSDKTRRANPPAPFTTSTLQQAASQRMSMDAKRTMSVAQKLYEAGHITYMRTDSTVISKEAMETIKKEVEAKYGEEYYQRKEYVNKKANTQEAHECVRPTKITYSEIEGTPDEKRLYSLIWKRTIQSQMKAAEYQNIVIEIELLGRKAIITYKLVGTLENLIFPGYLIVDGKKGTISLSTNILKSLLINWLTINGIEDTQKPPCRYNDASLINKMDPKNLNIGRPSTYASFIDKIVNRKYVEIKDVEGKTLALSKYSVTHLDNKTINLETRDISIGKEKKKLVPTDLGRNVTDFLEKNFSKLMDYKFTATMETQLDDVADGILDKNKIIKPFYDYVMEQVGKIEPVQYEHSNNFKPPEPIGKYGKSNIVLNNGKFGKYITCDIYKFNLATLFGMQNKTNNNNDLEEDLEAELAELDEDEIISKSANNEKQNINLDLDKVDNDTIVAKVIEKIEQIKNTSGKEWKIGKKKYILKNGTYGYYVEEYSTISKKKTANYSIKYLLAKIQKNNQVEQDEAIELITEKDIEETVEYFSNSKGKFKKSYEKK
jgi:DNA topoisomerase-1